MTRTQQNLSVIVVVITLMTMLAMRNGVTLPTVEPVTPAPIAAPGLNLLIVEESEDTDDLPRGQQEILSSQKWRRAWMDKGGEIRKVDPTNEHPLDDPKWGAAAKAIEQANLALPAYAISNGKTGETGPLPGSLAEWESLLAKWGQP